MDRRDLLKLVVTLPFVNFNSLAESASQAVPVPPVKKTATFILWTGVAAIKASAKVTIKGNKTYYEAEMVDTVQIRSWSLLDTDGTHIALDIECNKYVAPGDTLGFIFERIYE